MTPKIASVLALLSAFTLIPAAHAATFDESIPTAQTLQQLEQQALQADPREQIFLYTQLVHSMTELAGRQLLEGDADRASATLKQVARYVQLIHVGLARDSKRLKNAQLLMHHTTVRLNDFLHAASGDDRDTLQATLKQLDSVQDELLNQVFAR
ncbi:MAG: hypothetical protein KGK08_02610 [Acidobacteriota bacterium]|nr:hypothetical protein [Acidobacteriota bacterium]